MGQNETIALKPHKVEPVEEGLKNNEIPGADPKPQRQAKGRIDAAQESDREEQIAVEVAEQTQWDHQGALGTDSNHEEKDQRSVYPQVQQQHHHESKIEPTHRRKCKIKER